MIHSMHPKLDQWQQDKNHVKLVLVKGKDLDFKYDTPLCFFILSNRGAIEKTHNRIGRK